MEYVSTRGEAPQLGFKDTLLSGLATDGGLYVPKSWPQFSKRDIKALRGKPYADVAFAIIHPFVGGEIPDDLTAEAVKLVLLHIFVFAVGDHIGQTHRRALRDVRKLRH